MSTLLTLGLLACLIVIGTEGLRYVAGLCLRFAYPNGNRRAQQFLDILEKLRIALMLWGGSIVVGCLGYAFWPGRVQEFSAWVLGFYAASCVLVALSALLFWGALRGSAAAVMDLGRWLNPDRGRDR